MLCRRGRVHPSRAGPPGAGQRVRARKRALYAMSRFDLNQSIFVSPYGMSVGTPVADDGLDAPEAEVAPQQAQPRQAVAAAHPQRAGTIGGGGMGAAAPAAGSTTAMPLREINDEWR